MALEWQPCYPDRLPRLWRSSAHPSLFPATSISNLDPIINPLPPVELAGQPFYPPQQLGRVRLAPRPIGSGFVLGRPPILDLRWQPRYPDRIVRPRPHPSRMPSIFAPSPEIIIAPRYGAWRPDFPDRVPALRVRPPRRQQEVWLVDPATLLRAASCVEWTDRDFIPPTFADDAVVVPTFADETLIVPTLDEESLC